MAILMGILYKMGGNVKPLCFLSKTKALKRLRTFFEVLGCPWNAPVSLCLGNHSWRVIGMPLFFISLLLAGGSHRQATPLSAWRDPDLFGSALGLSGQCLPVSFAIARKFSDCHF
jgi:hypothetical protein